MLAIQKSMLIYRHTLPVRIMHWINVLCFIVLFMSGLNIFNAHPALNLGKSSYNGRAPLLELKAEETETGKLLGKANVFGYEFDTTGVLGVSRDSYGRITERGFPSWITIPGSQWLAMARRWHLFFAWVFVLNGTCYLLYSFLTKHIQRDLAPTHQDRLSIWQSIKDHIHFRHPSGEAARHYNVLQKLAYLSVIFILLPLIIGMGWAMSPLLNSLIPGWVDLFGGRQTARTIHFIVAWLLVAFVFVHVFEVIITGVWNNMRSMITGQYRIDTAQKELEENHDASE
jgi:thiosulfate reductase cytochrome b subunit